MNSSVHLQVIQLHTKCSEQKQVAVDETLCVAPTDAPH